VETWILLNCYWPFEGNGSSNSNKWPAYDVSGLRLINGECLKNDADYAMTSISSSG
jgi:hypothetical protein